MADDVVDMVLELFLEVLAYHNIVESNMPDMSKIRRLSNFKSASAQLTLFPLFWSSLGTFAGTFCNQCES